MKEWMHEMQKWKTYQQEWEHSFREWKYANDMDVGGHHGSHNDHYDGHHGSHNDHYDGHHDGGMDHDMGGGIMDDIMMTMGGMWEMIGPFISDPDVLCPILGMVGPGWDEGCRDQMKFQMNMQGLIMKMDYMDSATFAK